MCGIVGYIGKREAYPILVKGLHRLEYRGYDSAGCALLSQEGLKVYKAKTASLLGWYEQKGVLVQISGVGDADEIAKSVAEVLAR